MILDVHAVTHPVKDIKVQMVKYIVRIVIKRSMANGRGIRLIVK